MFCARLGSLASLGRRHQPSRFGRRVAGVNGRKINFISYDDAYSPSKTVEQARKVVESDEVFLIFAPLGTASNAAIQTDC